MSTYLQDERARRITRAAKMYVAGLTGMQIATELGVTRRTIWRYLAETDVPRKGGHNSPLVVPNLPQVRI